MSTALPITLQVSHAFIRPFSTLINPKSLRETLKGKLYERSDTGYDLSKWSENAKRPAKYVAQPLNVQDISKVIKVRADYRER